MVYILRGVPFDSSYKHTRWLGSKGGQEQYFITKKAYLYSQVAPVRPGQPLRLPINMSQIYDCNYIMFQNTNYNDKWFYAFITDIRWVNVNACEIDYELDVVQTWLYDYNFRECFVEREHALTDIPGDNLVLENLELGDYTYQEPINTNKFSAYYYMVAATVDKQGNDAVGGNYAGVYSGLEYNMFATPAQLNQYIDLMVSQSKADSIVSISMFPAPFVADKGSSEAELEVVSVPKNNGYGSGQLDGYTPRNKKLLTYPFNFLFCTNLAGGSANFPYEYFSTDNCQFYIFCDMTPNPTATLVPAAYKGVAQNYNEKITMDGFPICAWTTDTYKAWLAQNGSSTAITTMGNAFSGVANLMSFNFGGAVGNALSIAQTVAKVKATEALPPQAHGAAGNSSLVSLQKKDFYFYPTSIRKEYAEIIDNYFNMFGYATHKVKVPNFTGRQYWNYVETKNACVRGNVPQTAAARMEEILNSGITFWHDDNIGLYNRTNSILTGG